MVSDLVRDFGLLTLGSRLKRIGDQLQADAQRIADAQGLALPVAHYPYLAALDRDGPLTIGDLAVALGVSQPGVTRTIGLLARQELVKVSKEVADQRRKIVALSQQGQQLVALSKREIWPRIEAGVADLCADLSGPLLVQLAAIEQGLVDVPLYQRAARQFPSE